MGLNELGFDFMAPDLCWGKINWSFNLSGSYDMSYDCFKIIAMGLESDSAHL